jgi:predicted DNA-binding ribbon-helix-helix protein
MMYFRCADLCDFCNALEFFSDSHSAGQIFYSDVTNLLQQPAGGVIMKSLIVKRSIVAAGHKTSVSLEDAFWDGLKEIARGRNITLSELVSSIDSERRHGNLSSSIRLFVLDFYRNKLADVQAGGDGPGGDLAIRAEAVMPPCDIPPTPKTGVISKKAAGK